MTVHTLHKIPQISDHLRRRGLQSLRYAEAEMMRHLDCAIRLEGRIDELAASVHEAQTDWNACAATRELERARRMYADHVRRCGEWMGEVSGLREKLGLPAHPMVAVKATP